MRSAASCMLTYPVGVGDGLPILIRNEFSFYDVLQPVHEAERVRVRSPLHIY